MEKRVKKLIIFVLIIAIILGGIIIYYDLKNKEMQKKSTDEIETISEEEKEMALDYNFFKVDDETDYLSIEKGINDYFNACSNKNIDNIMLLLDQNYVNKKEITKENVLKKINYYENFTIFFADEIYYKNDYTKDEDSFYATYYIKGTVWSNEFKNKEDIYLIINENLMDYTFSIYPQDDVNLNEKNFEDIINKEKDVFMKQYISFLDSENIEEIKEDENDSEIEEENEEVIKENEENNDEIEEENEEVIKENEENNDEIEEEKFEEDEEEIENNSINYLYSNVTDEYEAKRYLRKLVVEILYNNNTSKIYDLIEDETKENKFSNNENNFKKYIQENSSKLYDLDIKNIQTKYVEDDYYKIYDFKYSENENYYIYIKEAENYKINIKNN